MKEKIKLILFASGTGSNAENLIRHFKSSQTVQIVGLICNNPKAGALTKANMLGIKSILVTNEQVSSPGALAEICKKHEVDLIVLAGFLRKIPEDLVNSYPERIINLHPSLLPAYGGKGMYGMHVHQAVINAKEDISGITIHLVNEKYDEGKILAQFKTPVAAGESPENLAKKIQALELHFLPQVVDDYAKSLLKKS